MSAIDIPTRRVTVRHVEAAPARGVTYTSYDLDDFKAGRFDQPLGAYPQVGVAGTWQGFSLFGQYVYWHEGNSYEVAGNAPPGNEHIGCVRNDGRLVERVFQGVDPDLPVREPEAIQVYYGEPGDEPRLIFGYSIDGGSRRHLALYSLPLYPVPVTPPTLPVKPLPSRGEFAAGGPIPDIDSVTARIPFAVTAGGWVSTTTDEYLALLDRVHALVSTQPGERAMRVTYGVPTASTLFMPVDVARTELEQSIAEAVARWEPSARISSVDTDINPHLGLVNVRVQVSRADAPQQESVSITRNVRIGVGGTVSITPGYYRPPTATA